MKVKVRQLPRICKNCFFSARGGNGIIWCSLYEEHSDDSDTCDYFKHKQRRYTNGRA